MMPKNHPQIEQEQIDLNEEIEVKIATRTEKSFPYDPESIEFQKIHNRDIENIEAIRTMELKEKLESPRDKLEEVERQELKNTEESFPAESTFYKDPVDEYLKGFFPSYCFDEQGFIRDFQGIFCITETFVDHPLTDTAYIVYAKPDPNDQELLAFCGPDQLAIEAFPDLALNEVGGFTMLEPGQLINTVIVPPKNEFDQFSIIIYAHPDPNLMMITDYFPDQNQEKQAA